MKRLYSPFPYRFPFCFRSRHLAKRKVMERGDDEKVRQHDNWLGMYLQVCLHKAENVRFRLTKNGKRPKTRVFGL